MANVNADFPFASEKPFSALEDVTGVAQGRFQLSEGSERHAGTAPAQGQDPAWDGSSRMASRFPAMFDLLGISRSVEQAFSNYVAVTDAQGRFRCPNLASEAIPIPAASCPKPAPTVVSHPCANLGLAPMAWSASLAT